MKQYCPAWFFSTLKTYTIAYGLENCILTNYVEEKIYFDFVFFFM